MSLVARVADLAEQIRGVSYRKEDASSESRPGYLPILRAGNIGESELLFDDLVFVPAEHVSERQRIRRNDVIIAASSGSIDVVGKAARATRDYDAGFGAFCKILRPRARVDPSYFSHFFRTPSYRRRVSALAAGVNINNLRNEDLDRIEIPLPSLPEQRRIAEILDKADALRAMRRAALAELDTLTESIFLEMFGDSDSNPGGWPTARVDDVAEVQGGLQVTTARATNPLVVPYLRVANVLRGRLDLREVKTIRATAAEVSRTRLARGDLLLVEGHGNPLEIGRAALWDGSIDNCVHQNHLIRVRCNSWTMHPTYALELLNSSAGRRHLLRSAKTTSGLNTITVNDVRATPILVPPLRIQNEFAHRIERATCLREKQEGHLSALDSLFCSLQHRAFRGEL